MIDGDEKASLEQLLPALELIAVKNSKMINMPRHDIVWGQGVEIFGHFHTLEKNIIKTLFDKKVYTCHYLENPASFG